MKKVLIFSVLLLGACETFDMRAVSEFEVASNTDFRYQNIANVAYPVDSPQGEKARMTRLEEYLNLNALCPGG